MTAILVKFKLNTKSKLSDIIDWKEFKDGY